MKTKLKTLYSDFIQSVANMSKCNRKKVGAVIVSPDDENIVAYGWNGRPRNSCGCDSCEDESGNTKSDVIHAEMNCIAKLARTGGSSNGCSIFVTLSPCSNCALLIIQAGIKNVYYIEEYRDPDGIRILKESGIHVEKLES